MKKSFSSSGIILLYDIGCQLIMSISVHFGVTTPTDKTICSN